MVRRIDSIRQRRCRELWAYRRKAEARKFSGGPSYARPKCASCGRTAKHLKRGLCPDCLERLPVR